MATIYQAHKEMAQAEQAFCAAFIAKSTSQQRNSKYWSAGTDEFFGSKQHLDVLNKFGYADSDAYYDALHATPESIAYHKFDLIIRVLDSCSAEYRSLVSAMKDVGLWNENDNVLHGVSLLRLAETHAPKQTQLLTLAAELGYEVIDFNGNLQLNTTST